MSKLITVNYNQKPCYNIVIENDFSKLASLEPVIKEYFDKTMVMAKDETVKENRLKELTKLARMINYFAEVDKIIVK